ncbi:MAG: ADP-ribosylglycohydrolase family protein [Marinobacter sp.]|uniref:ADP-ribosylglycohydrolase family protein n=2 Tax=Marinobacter sp. TaxID=50741 RepID=UPI0039750685
MSGTQQGRVMGAIMGAFVSEALGVGPHWCYDLKDLRRAHGDWIDDYTTPEPGRFHHGLTAGQNSQAGFILELMLRSLVEYNGYDEADFCHRLDNDFFPLLDGKRRSGPGHYTSESIRHAWKRRVDEKRPWHDIGGAADTTEAMERTLAIAVRYAASDIAATATDPAIRIEPAWKVSYLYGMPCAFYHQLPAAYYLAARFSDDFESAVLHAINGGGQNQSRAMLAGALAGAQVGLAGIPQRFLDGLERADALQQLAYALASTFPGNLVYFQKTNERRQLLH